MRKTGGGGVMISKRIIGNFLADYVDFKHHSLFPLSAATDC